MKRLVKSIVVMLVLVAIANTALVGCSSAQSQDPDWRRVAVFKGDSNQQTKVFHIKSDSSVILPYSYARLGRIIPIILITENVF